MKYELYGTVVGTKYLGIVEADSEEDARQQACDLDTFCVCLCHACASECDDANITSVIVEAVDNS